LNVLGAGALFLISRFAGRCRSSLVGECAFSPLSFPRGVDCILSRGTMCTRPTPVQSLTAFPAGSHCSLRVESHHADCPILAIITVPEFCSPPRSGFPRRLVRKALRGFPNNKVSRRSRDHRSFPPTSSQWVFGGCKPSASCFLAPILVIYQLLKLRPPIPLWILRML